MSTEDTKLIHHNAGGTNLPDDPSYPWKLYVNLAPPEFMGVAFCMLHGGSEEIVVRGMTRETLIAFADEHGLNETHPRYRRMEITGPGVTEDHVRGKPPVVTPAAPVEQQPTPP